MMLYIHFFLLFPLKQITFWEVGQNVFEIPFNSKTLFGIINE